LNSVDHCSLAQSFYRHLSRGTESQLAQSWITWFQIRLSDHAWLWDSLIELLHNSKRVLLQKLSIIHSQSLRDWRSSQYERFGNSENPDFLIDDFFADLLPTAFFRFVDRWLFCLRSLFFFFVFFFVVFVSLFVHYLKVFETSTKERWVVIHLTCNSWAIYFMMIRRSLQYFASTKIILIDRSTCRYSICCLDEWQCKCLLLSSARARFLF